MNKKANIEAKIEEVMSSLDAIEPASPRPFFFARVQQRLSRPTRSSWEIVSGFLARPMVATMALTLVLGLNLAVIFSGRDTFKSRPPVAMQDEYAQAIAIYDTENIYR